MKFICSNKVHISSGDLLTLRCNMYEFFQNIKKWCKIINRLKKQQFWLHNINIVYVLFSPLSQFTTQDVDTADTPFSWINLA